MAYDDRIQGKLSRNRSIFKLSLVRKFPGRPDMFRWHVYGDLFLPFRMGKWAIKRVKATAAHSHIVNGQMCV